MITYVFYQISFEVIEVKHLILYKEQFLLQTHFCFQSFGEIFFQNEYLQISKILHKCVTKGISNTINHFNNLTKILHESVKIKRLNIIYYIPSSEILEFPSVINKHLGEIFNPNQNKPWFLCVCSIGLLKTRNEQFLLSPQCFLLIWRTFCNFRPI